MRLLISLLALAMISLAGCVHEPIHQGNRLDENRIYQIKEGDTKFYVEQVLGTPMLDSTLNPNRATYYEEFEDQESGKMIRRSVVITYDDALRVIEIKRLGFEKKELP